MAIVATLAGLLVKSSVPARAARPLAWALTLLVAGGLAWIAWSLWLSSHDDDVVARDRGASNAAVLNGTIAAERGAGAAKHVRDRAFDNTQDQLEEKVDGAAGNGTSPLDALFDELR